MNTQVEKQDGHPQTEGHDLEVRQKQAATTETAGTHEGRYFEPRVDIYETAEALVVKADLPGVLPDDVQTDLKDSLLTLVARVRPVEGAWKPLHEEYAVGHFTRQFRLGQQIDQAKITAQLKDGVLTLTLPKADRHKPRRIQVNAG
jgi:HSP20 family protein